ncbi:hypothetical protein MBM_04935 [Drepanopeziza brunnea f. sp. 'multigermtubi' MB_m1]|uniref:L-ascorbate oxidase n=1 Tax=Marssonina brunnea f. sp. multigermtubi (strain MB_m1) TaxID=1072389 RepID=K1WTT4_MARBU|nr:uncharacterized protein MBM_04935 [Drepanopeziza brunnea f. sp. 'multigermtubi' MB_m1]EKD16466.1 hypothetical protein MBM_04935 [Drepanopeziza brunnea f. sp. 'multigermtubi' MB_m1]
MLFQHHPLFALFALLVSFFSIASAKTVVHDETFIPDAILRVTEADTTQACLAAKPIVLVNGTSPGPALTLRAGEVYWIRVYNDMHNQNLTMHWHGLAMTTSPFSDGTPLASQWPIPPQKFFDYELGIPTHSAGTYFYHSHVGMQAISATGPLIVEDKLEVPYYYDEERIILLQDVFAKDDLTLEKGLLANPLVWSGESEMILVNGKGAGTANGKVCNGTLASLDVQPGKTYRLRFIGGTALTFASLAIEGHDLTIIEVDGAYTQPYNTSFLQLGSGQRYSVLLTTKSAPEKSAYYMQIESRDRPTLTRSFAVLNYGVPSPPTIFYPPPSPPITLPDTEVAFLDYDLAPHPDHEHLRMPCASEVTRTITMVIHQRYDGVVTWVQNSFPWQETFPKEPYLVSLYNGDVSNFPSMERALANGGIDPVTRTFPAQIGEVLEIIIQNTGSDNNTVDSHPYHAHGEHFWDLGMGDGAYDQAANEAKWAAAAARGASPIRRDTSMVRRYSNRAPKDSPAGWRAWRLRVTQPGVWMLHCHILPHMVMGMQTVWVHGNRSEVLRDVQDPDVQGYLKYGGDVLGDRNSWPSVVEFQSGKTWTDGQ